MPSKGRLALHTSKSTFRQKWWKQLPSSITLNQRYPYLIHLTSIRRNLCLNQNPKELSLHMYYDLSEGRFIPEPWMTSDTSMTYSKGYGVISGMNSPSYHQKDYSGHRADVKERDVRSYFRGTKYAVVSLWIGKSLGNGPAFEVVDDIAGLSIHEQRIRIDRHKLMKIELIGKFGCGRVFGWLNLHLDQDCDRLEALKKGNPFVRFGTSNIRQIFVPKKLSKAQNSLPGDRIHTTVGMSLIQRFKSFNEEIKEMGLYIMKNFVVPDREGQSIGVIVNGEDANGKPHRLR
ncbi:hypothetical protein RND71_008296 [Anisodus tanguticus]|uniref:Uncharacterized protein n=1 Tax=Anisodus tanguticus TaxID=243964 RepID=A0AAE1SN50_9SOLA|nr:hypothetical protein RND71_008296 [Anisodus tanguticus]